MTQAVAASPRASGSLIALYRLLLRTQVTLPRLLGIGALGGLAILLGMFARSDAAPTQAAADAVDAYGFAVLIPLATLWFGTAAIGDLVEDRLLVYLWLKPVPRWQLPAAAVLATLTVVLPLTVVPLTVSTLVAGAGDLAAATLAATALAALAFSGLFVAAGLWFRRAVWWGLAWVLIWENAAAYVADGVAYVTVRGWASSILDLAPGLHLELRAGSAGAALVVLPTIAVAAWRAATWRYRRADID